MTKIDQDAHQKQKGNARVEGASTCLFCQVRFFFRPRPYWENLLSIGGAPLGVISVIVAVAIITGDLGGWGG